MMRGAGLYFALYSSAIVAAIVIFINLKSISLAKGIEKYQDKQLNIAKWETYLGYCSWDF